MSWKQGSISVSMTVHQISFCFICSHLASGQKEGDEFKRNSDVLEILRLTRFSRLCRRAGRRISWKILEHDKVIWFGDLNYRIALSYADTLIGLGSKKSFSQKIIGMPFSKRTSLKLNGMLVECLRGETRGRYILPPHTSTPITRMLMLVRLQHQIKRGEHQHGYHLFWCWFFPGSHRMAFLWHALRGIWLWSTLQFLDRYRGKRVPV